MSEKSVRKTTREISQFPPPYSRHCTPHKQSRFSPTTLENASRGRSVLASKLAKMILLGDCGVGKTCLVNRFCHNAFDGNYKATIGVDFEMQRFDVLGTPLNLQIWDTAGQERFKCIAKSYYRDANVIAIVFDVTDNQTLSNAKNWLEDAREVNGSFSTPFPPPVFLIGTKKDLLNEKSCIQVVEKASAVAAEMRAELWLVSSKTASSVASGIEDLFFRMAAISFDSIMVKQSRDWHLNSARQIGATDAIKLSTPSNLNDVFERRKLPASCSAAQRCKYY